MTLFELLEVVALLALVDFDLVAGLVSFDVSISISVCLEVED